MRSVFQTLKTWFNTTDDKPPKSLTKLEKFKREGINTMDSDENFLDRHRYWRMESDDKKNPKSIPLTSFPEKKVYKCLGWQLHPYDIKKLTEYIDATPRLIRVENESLLAGAAEADILIITSGSGKYHIDSFLSDIDTSKKLIIIASVRELNSVKQDIKHRIDGHFNKINPFSKTDFKALIDEVIEKAIKGSITNISNS